MSQSASFTIGADPREVAIRRALEGMTTSELHEPIARFTKDQLIAIVIEHAPIQFLMGLAEDGAGQCETVGASKGEL